MQKNIASKSRMVRREIERKFSSQKKLSQKDLGDILYKMKYNLKIELSEAIIDGLDIDNKNFLLGCPLPDSYSCLRTLGTSPFKISFPCELNWIALSLKYFHKELSLFLYYERQFESKFLIGNYEEAKSILDKIDSEVCVSQWSIEKRLLLCEYCKTLAPSKSNLIELVKNKAERLIKINSSYLSVRFEAQLPPNRFDEILNKFAVRQKNPALANYFLFKLNFYNNLQIDQPEIALYLESNLSIIDRYQFLLQIILSLLCNKATNDQYIEPIKTCVSNLVAIISDPRLLNIGIYLGQEFEDIQFTDCHIYFKIIELFNQSHFEDCYKLCQTELEERPYNIEVIEIFVKTCILLDKECPVYGNQDALFNSVLNALYNVFVKNSEYESSVYKLTKIAKSIAAPLWCNKIIEILNNEQAIVNTDYNFSLYTTLSFHCISPGLSSFINDRNKFDLFIKNFKSSNKYSVYIFSDPRALSDEKSIEVVGTGLFHDFNSIAIYESNSNFEGALSHIEKITKHPQYQNLLDQPFIQVELIRKKIFIYLNTNELTKALELLCSTIISNEKLLLNLNNSKLQSAILSSDDLEIRQNICTPILARAYKEKINEIWIAYDNFMYQNNYTFPKELFNTTIFDEQLLKFFLRYVCIQDVYDSSPFFTSIEDLDNERIKICNHLSLIDPQNKDIYVDEIAETETRALIKKGIKEVDESKIYVDTTGIWREIEMEVKERFTRGREILKMGKDEIDYLFEMSTSVLVLYISKNEDEGGVFKFDKAKDKEEGIINHPHFENFKETFLLIRDRFISSNEYGLDSYVSMRIRHGTLLGQIRSIFERYNLITKKDNYTKQYIQNDYWLNKLKVDLNQKQLISEILNSFSENIDQMADQIKNSFLQIKTEEKSLDGLFDYRFDNKELISLYQSKFYNIDNHMNFFESMVEVLWERTEKNLNIIRDKFTNEYCGGSLRNLEELFNSIDKHNKSKSSFDTSELLRDITACKTDTSNAFEKISLWFRRSYSNSINEFDIRLVVNICFSIVNKMHPQSPISSPKISITSDSIFKGEYFTFFIDIMRNVLDNIIDRSELSEPSLKVVLNIKEENDQIKISLENNVASTLDLNAANRKIATTQLRVDNNEVPILVQKEGGSGYLKIKNLLKGNLKRKNYTLKIEPIKNDRVFRSFISFELTNLIK